MACAGSDLTEQSRREVFVLVCLQSAWLRFCLINVGLQSGSYLTPEHQFCQQSLMFLQTCVRFFPSYVTCFINLPFTCFQESLISWVMFHLCFSDFFLFLFLEHISFLVTPVIFGNIGLNLLLFAPSTSSLNENPSE